MDGLIATLAGILGLLGVIYGISEWFLFDFFGIGRRRAKRDFPAVAETLGLTFSASRDRSEIGEIKGEYEGRNVTISPDRNATILFSTAGLPDVFLSTKVYEKKNFDTGNSAFDSFFLTRSMSKPEKVRRQIENSGAALDYLPVFSRRWKRKLDFFEISEDGIRLSLKYGMNSYVPAKDLEQLLPDLNKFAGMLEDVLGKT